MQQSDHPRNASTTGIEVEAPGLHGVPFLVAVFLVAVSASLAYGQAPPAGEEDNKQQEVEELKKRIEELGRRNRELQLEKEKLEDQLLELTEREEPEPIDIRELPDEDDRYLFLNLGTKKDYLKAERLRIADQIESFIPPLYEPVRPFHAFTLPPGAIRISLGGKIFRNNADFGRDSNYAKLFRHVTVRSQQTNLSIKYGFELPHFPDAVLAVDLPFRSVDISGEGHPFRLGPLGITMDGGGQGLGDISVTLKKKWLDQGNVGFNFATFTGVIIPTGKDDIEFDGAPTMKLFGIGLPLPIPLNLFSRNFFAQNLPPALQAGQGAFGFRVGAAVTRQFKRSALHAGAIVDLLANNGGIRPGNEVKYGVSFVFPPLESDTLTIDLSVFGRYKADSKFRGFGIMGPREDFKNGNVVFFSPSIILTPSPQMRFFMSPEFRILEPNRGPSPEFALTAGMTFTF